MIKQVVIIYQNGKPVELCDIKTFQNTNDFLKFKEEVEFNKTLLDQENERKEKKILELEKRIKLLELEAKYNRGEITEKEYEELCGGIN